MREISGAMKRLSELRPGESGKIVRIDDEEDFLRLMEMGFIKGEEVQVINLAPLGDPMMVKIIGYQVSLRMNEAERIMVSCIEKRV